MVTITYFVNYYLACVELLSQYKWHYLHVHYTEILETNIFKSIEHLSVLNVHSSHCVCMCVCVCLSLSVSLSVCLSVFLMLKVTLH